MLKDLIRTSFAAFRGAHRSVPDAAYVASDKQVVFDGRDHNVTYTAPADGYLFAQFNSLGATLYIVIRKGALDWVNSRGLNNRLCVSLPVRKGETVTLIGGGSEDRATLTVYLRFHPYIGENPNGGGVKALLRALCAHFMGVRYGFA